MNTPRTSQQAAASDEKPARPRTGRGRWTSFVATDADADAGGPVVRGLREQTNPKHRLRVEHDARTLLIHLSDEDGGGWTTIAVDRATRQWAVAQDDRQTDAAKQAYERLYEPRAKEAETWAQAPTKPQP